MTDEIPPHLTDAERGRWWTCTATETTSDVLVRRNDLRTISKLRALLAEQTARAERAEADYRRVLSERAEANQLAGRCAQQRDAALAANAEMRAALEDAGTELRLLREKDGAGPYDQTLRTRIALLLSRPDLGAGMVVVERESIDEWRDLIVDLVFDLDVHSRAKKAVADLDALLKKGGG